MRALKELLKNLFNSRTTENDLLFDALNDLKSKRAPLVEILEPRKEIDELGINGDRRNVDVWSFRMMIKTNLMDMGWPSTYNDAHYSKLFDTLFVLYENCDTRESFDKMMAYLPTAGEPQKYALSYILQSINDIETVARNLDYFKAEDLDMEQTLLFSMGKSSTKPSP